MCHLWRQQSANQWHPAPPTPVSMSLCHSDTLRTITGLPLVCLQHIFLAVQHPSLAIPCEHLASNPCVAFEALSPVENGAGDKERPLTGPGRAQGSRRLIAALLEN